MRAPILACVLATLIGAGLAGCRREMPHWPGAGIELPKPNWP
jgi:hypothetical protein